MPMTNDRKHLDPIERALLELRDMETCRVESRTPLDESVLSRPIGVSSAFRMLRWSRVAAVLGIVAVSWGVMFSFEISSVRTNSQTSNATSDQTPAPDLENCGGAFVRQFTGPVGAMASSHSFQGYDYDGDGDVDLADFQKFQLDCTGPA